MSDFKACGLPALIGSVPMKDHNAATKLVMEYVAEIPLWVQLPAYKEEGMVAQFLPGMPGIVDEDDRTFIDSAGEGFDEEVLHFYEDYLMITEGGADIAGSRFEVSEKSAKGFYELIKQVKASPEKIIAVKGQITGPVTFATGTTDREGRAIFYDDQLRDIAVKQLAMKAGWQTKELSRLGFPVIIFFDEPGLAGFGSSAFLTITKEDVTEAIGELIQAVHAEKGLAGVHVCANTEWDLLLDSELDIISFDAYSYFDKFILYGDKIKAFIDKGGILAFGIVPTSNTEDIDKESAESLAEKWEEQAAQLKEIGIDRAKVLEHTLITPSCGTGSLPFDSALRVLELTKDVSKILRNK